MLNTFISANLNFVSYFGDTVFLPVGLLIFSVAYLVNIGYRRQALLVLLAALSNPLSYILKYLYKSPRPPTAHYKYSFDQYGLPSGHAMFYTVVFGYLLFLCFKLKVLPCSLRWVVGLASVYFIALVGISRVYLGQHYVLDVVAGYFFGLLYLLAVILIDLKA